MILSFKSNTLVQPVGAIPCLGIAHPFGATLKLACILLAFSCVTAMPHASLAQSPDRPGYKVAWFDEFEKPELDQSLWTALDKKKPTNNSRQDYLPKQVSIANGKLVITSVNQESRGLPYLSGLITSKKLQKYGRWDVRAKLPESTGMWPAIWLLPDEPWPTAGEIDIMENRGNQPTIVSSAIHYGTRNPWKHDYLDHECVRKVDGVDVNFHSGWHLYSCEWEPTVVRFYVDNKLHWTVRDDETGGFLSKNMGPMRVIINTAVGGDFLDNPNETTVWPQKFEIDYVHAYARVEDADANAAVVDAVVVEAANAGADRTLRVMSFNLRYGLAKDGDNQWERRKDLVVETIATFDPDLLGVQESLEFQAAYVGGKLPGYQYVGRSRDSKANGGEQCGIFIRAGRFDKLGEGHFWLSESPDEPGSQGWDSAYPRMATWVKLWDRRNRQSLFLLNTHFDHIGKTARLESAKLIERFVAELPGHPTVIITGDFNSGENSKPYQALFSADSNGRTLIDTYRSYVPTTRDQEGTFHAFSGDQSGQRIDWIGATKNLSVEAAAIVSTASDNRYPSDHFPVTAVLNFAATKQIAPSKDVETPAGPPK